MKRCIRAIDALSGFIGGLAGVLLCVGLVLTAAEILLRSTADRTLFITDEYIRRIDKTLEDIYRYPLYQSATDTLNRQLKAGINDHDLIDLVFSLREDGRLCLVDEQDQQREPRLICSLGLA